MNIYLKFIKVTGMIFLSVAFFVSAMSFDVINTEDLEKEVDGILNKYINISVPGASVSVVKDGEILFSKGYGFADIENKIPVIPEETVFEYGSINKLFVWVSAMQLAEAGKIDLNENVEKYLPEEVRRNLKYNSSITMLDLMNHTAGFEDTLFDFAKKDLGSLPKLEETVQISQPDQVFTPREIISYSNYGSTLAAYVIHEISGERFFDYERKNIFFPLEMENIAGHPLYKYNPKLINNKAKGYISEKDGSFREKGWVYVPGYPSGAADGTVTALAKFAMALTPENPVDSPLFDTKEAFEELFKQSYSLENIDTSVAHGFWEFGGKIKSYGHGGNTAGFTSYFAVAPETRTGLIVLTNSGEETDLIYELHEQIFGEIEMEKRSAMVSPSAYEVSGRYIPARAPHKNFLELFSYLSAYEVIEENEGEIKLLIPGHEAKYTQVAPYKYNISEASSRIIKFLYPELFFEKDGNSIKRVTSGNSVDLIPVNTFRSWAGVMTAVIILSSGFLFFLVHPLLLIFNKMKLKNNISIKMIYLSFLGFILAVNNIMLILRAFENLYYSSANVQIFILINIAIASIFLISSVGFLLLKKKDTLLYSSVFLLVLITLYNWNFMTLF
ncbi:MAG: hypothetical protein EOM04_07605 [Clostridia bacterium]|nr:hypothetical protein [Clostridia bacterium]